MTIQRISVAPGATFTANLIAVTGFVGEFRAPFPTPGARISPDDGSVFTVGVDGTLLTVTGVEEGEGTLTLINAEVSPPLETDIVVTVQRNAATVRWALDAPIITGGTPTPPPPGDVTRDIIVNDQRVQITYSGDGSDRPIDIDWGDGNTETLQPADNPAQHDYGANGNYTITSTPQADGDVVYPTVTDAVTIDHYPVVTEDFADPILTLTHDKGDISTSVDWGDGTSDSELADMFSHQYTVNGTYDWMIRVGGFPNVTGTVTVGNAGASGGSKPPENAVCTRLEGPDGLTIWVCVGNKPVPQEFPSLGFDIDKEPGVDIQIAFNNVPQAIAKATPAQKMFIYRALASAMNR